MSKDTTVSLQGCIYHESLKEWSGRKCGFDFTKRVSLKLEKALQDKYGTGYVTSVHSYIFKDAWKIIIDGTKIAPTSSPHSYTMFKGQLVTLLYLDESTM